MFVKCVFKGCGRPVLAKGLCDAHYQQQKYGVTRGEISANIGTLVREGRPRKQAYSKAAKKRQIT